MTKPNIVLFIDDDEEDLAFFSEAMSIIDPSIKRLTAPNGLAAIKLLESPDLIIPDFIFLDINMPIMNGMECLVKLKTMDRLKEVPIIMCSTSIYAEDQKECERLGANFYLVKPNTIIQLVSSLQFVFSRYQLKIKEQRAEHFAA